MIDNQTVSIYPYGNLTLLDTPPVGLGQPELYKYKEGNNRPSSVNQISLVNNLDKVGNKYCAKDNKNSWENQVCEKVPRKSKLYLLRHRTRHGI